MSDCFVCRKQRGEIAVPGGAIYEDELVYASIPASWLDSLAPRGRLLLPLTVSIAGMNAGVGWMLLVRRDGAAYGAEFRTPVGIYHCAGARSGAGEERLRRLFDDNLVRGPRRLRRDAHEEDSSCARSTAPTSASAQSPGGDPNVPQVLRARGRKRE